MDAVRIIQAVIFGIVILVPLYMKLRGIHKQMNSRLDELIRSVRAGALQEGRELEQKDQRERHAKDAKDAKD